MIVCSATLHSFDVKKLSERIMHFPTWVDLKGEDSVPETVHHVVVPVNPKSDHLWERLGKNHIRVSSMFFTGTHLKGEEASVLSIMLVNLAIFQTCLSECRFVSVLMLFFLCSVLFFSVTRLMKFTPKTTPDQELILQVISPLITLWFVRSTVFIRCTSRRF